ncbi:MAG: hypothetical protein A2V88_01450 [Elusimicrobia bacterium RBG_16_66_12]|nr:MAG: hypothetical protein A2V88_01450 [Elusimicrobia bacterium RBG_16_66_12]
MGALELCIVPGFECNFACSHCAVSEVSEGGVRLSGAEVGLLQETVRSYAPHTLAFTGGEPTLYVEDINSLIAAHPGRDHLTIRLTTNGHFATDRDSIVQTLDSFVKLDEIQLSYDRFHSEFIPSQQAGLLYQVCVERGLRFSIVISLTSPVDLVIARELRQFGDMPISFQKVLAIGRAKTNGLAYQYPAFDPAVLEASCPNRGQVFYICGRGFSMCCSALVFNGAFPGVIHPTLEEHLKSDFYNRVSSSRFSELMAGAGVGLSSLAPQHSSPCALCEHLFSSRRSPAYVPLSQPH